MPNQQVNRCIVCGRAVPKRTQDVLVRPLTGEYGGWREANITADIKTRSDCQSHTNHQIVSIKKNRDGLITRFTTWDGESYRFRGHFCTNNCAIEQGYASAYHGYRFTGAATSR